MQQGREPLDVDFCSITIDGSLDNDILQQRLHTVVEQREELQQMETELRAQLIARSEVMEMQNSFDAQIKEHANAAVKLQVYVNVFSLINEFFKFTRRYSCLRINKIYFLNNIMSVFLTICLNSSTMILEISFLNVRQNFLHSGVPEHAMNFPVRLLRYKFRYFVLLRDFY